MNEYRQRLKTQNVLYILGILALAGVQVLAHIGIISPASTVKNYADFWNGFIGGAAMGIMILLVVGLIINFRALKNDERLKKLFVKETDERDIMISVKGKSAGASAFVFTLVVAGIISGYFSVTVFVTLIASAFALSLFMCGGKIYYCKKL